MIHHIAKPFAFGRSSLEWGLDFIITPFFC
jgi:hypothetical protein